MIVKLKGRPVEVQVRTFLQDLWANLVEGLSAGSVDLKHGVDRPGYAGMLPVLEAAADVIANAEGRHADSLPGIKPPNLTIGEAAYYRTGLFRGIVWSAIHFHFRRIRDEALSADV